MKAKIVKPSIKLATNSESNKSDIKKLTDDKWEVTGNAAKAIIDEHENLKNTAIRCEKMMQDAHQQMWETVYKQTGLTKKDSLSINTEHADGGVIFVKRNDSGKNGLDGLLAALARSLTHDKE